MRRLVGSVTTEMEQEDPMNRTRTVKLIGILISATFMLTIVYLPRLLAANTLPSIVVDPNFGPALGGATVVIKGRDFRPGAKVSFGGREGQILDLSNTSITVDVPPGNPGNADVVVENPDGARAMLRGGFVFRQGVQIAGTSLLTASC